MARSRPKHELCCGGFGPPTPCSLPSARPLDTHHIWTFCKASFAIRHLQTLQAAKCVRLKVHTTPPVRRFQLVGERSRKPLRGKHPLRAQKVRQKRDRLFQKPHTIRRASQAPPRNPSPLSFRSSPNSRSDGIVSCPRPSVLPAPRTKIWHSEKRTLPLSTVPSQRICTGNSRQSLSQTLAKRDRRQRESLLS